MRSRCAPHIHRFEVVYFSAHMKIVLRPLRTSHAEVFARASKIPGFLDGLRYEAPMNVRQSIENVHEQLAQQAKGEMDVQSIVWDGKVVGRIGMRKRGRRWFLWYWIAPEYQKRGIAKEAIRKMLEQRREPLYAEVKHFNLASSHVLLSLGFYVIGKDRVFLRYAYKAITTNGVLDTKT